MQPLLFGNGIGSCILAALYFIHVFLVGLLLNFGLLGQPGVVAVVVASPIGGSTQGKNQWRQVSGSRGSDSSFHTVVGLGGGGGAGLYTTHTSQNDGGSGGGGNYQNPTTSAGAGTTGQGYAGGTASASDGGGGGGGGAGGAGGNTVAGTHSGDGGIGRTTDILGYTRYLAGGGGAGVQAGYLNNTAGVASWNGGKGGEASNGWTGQPGSVNTGGGGGSGGYSSGYYAGGAGGSGETTIRYSDIFPAAAATTGSPTYTVSGGYRTYRWTGSGSITFA